MYAAVPIARTLFQQSNCARRGTETSLRSRADPRGTEDEPGDACASSQPVRSRANLNKRRLFGRAHYNAKSNTTDDNLTHFVLKLGSIAFDFATSAKDQPKVTTETDHFKTEKFLALFSRVKVFLLLLAGTFVRLELAADGGADPAAADHLRG